MRLGRVVTGRVLLRKGRERVGASREAARSQVLPVATGARRELAIREAGEEVVVGARRRFRTRGFEEARLDAAPEIRRRLTRRMLFLEVCQRFGRGVAFELQNGDALARLGGVRRARLLGKEAAIDGRSVLLSHLLPVLTGAARKPECGDEQKLERRRVGAHAGGPQHGGRICPLVDRPALARA